ncbi:AAA family ATPase [Parashewanella tropica]|uniref:AAA family ATPase n=1 Tax=Parashewanella tropica TaxID=2547970 RepID=UPI001059B8C8|nr:ATP-binding protein [Parashewanella tropica]
MVVKLSSGSVTTGTVPQLELKGTQDRPYDSIQPTGTVTTPLGNFNRVYTTTVNKTNKSMLLHTAAKVAETDQPLAQQAAAQTVEVQQTSTSATAHSSIFNIKSEQDKLKVIDHCRCSNPSSPIINILSPLHLEEDGLKSSVIIDSKGGIKEQEGRLYSNQPLTLILDLTSMSPSQVASLNDLLDTPPSLNGKSLGKNISRVVLINPQMLKSGESQPNQDCWRRLTQFESYHDLDYLNEIPPAEDVTLFQNWSVPSQPTSSSLSGDSESEYESEFDDFIFVDDKPHLQKAYHDESKAFVMLDSPDLLIPREQGFDVLESHIPTTDQDIVFEDGRGIPRRRITIDFSNDNWKALLFGEISIDNNGQWFFKRGYLTESDEGCILIFRDAPWNSKKFVYDLRECLITRQFSANGVVFSLPDEMEIIREDTSDDEIESLKSQLLNKPLQVTPTQPLTRKQRILAKLPFRKKIVPFAEPLVCSGVVYLNGSNLDAILSDFKIQNGTPVYHDTFNELIFGKAELCITSDLSQHQWLRFLRRLERYKSIPRVTVWGTQDITPNPDQELNVSCHVFSNAADSLAFQNRESMVYQVTAKEDWESMWQEFKLQSQDRFQFQQTQTQLFDALVNGKKITLSGVERNSKILAQIETLFANPPYLFLHGKKHELPRAQVSIHLVLNEKQQQKLPKLLQYHNQRTEHLRERFALQSRTHTHRRLGKFKYIYDLLSALPPSHHHTYPATIPWEEADFNVLFDEQLKIETRQDGSYQPTNYHYKRALNTLITRAYRGDEKVYNYLKTHLEFTYEPTSLEEIDVNQLRQWMGKNQPLTRETLTKNFWLLVRHCPLTYFEKTIRGRKFTPTQEDIHNLLRCLHSIALPSQAEQLRTLDQELTPIDVIERNSLLFSQLRDALLVASSKRNKAGCISRQTQELAASIQPLITEYHTSSDREQEQALFLENITAHLYRYFDKELLDTDFVDLAEDLLFGTQNCHIRENRRLLRMCDRVRHHPIVFLQGEAGAGKSHLAKAVSNELSKQDPQFKHFDTPLVISLGPETTTCSLFGEQKLITDASGDSRTEFEDGPILKWAKDRNPQLLVLDEANIAKEGVIATLAGLCREPKQLCYQGRIYPLTSKHRVILTGNPDFYAGRKMDPDISSCMLTVHCRPLSRETQGKLIVKPSLPSTWPLTFRNQACHLVIQTFEEIASLIPEGLTPRDLHEVLTRISCTQNLLVTPPADMTQVHAIIFDAFEEAIEPGVPLKNKGLLLKLKAKLQQEFPCENSVLDIKKHNFNVFLLELREQNPSLDLRNEAVCALVQYYWSFLNKRSASNGLDKRALLVEGPSGWGKDTILEAVLELWEKDVPESQKYTHINANPDSWEESLREIQDAMKLGKKLVISELNLLPSDLIEGLFNEVLTCPSNPNFLLFATINPSSFEGREAASPAFKNRCVNIILTPLTHSDLEQILLNKFPGNEEAVTWLIQRFSVLNQELQKSRSPIPVTLKDLIQLTSLLILQPKENWPNILHNKFGLSMQSIDWDSDAIESNVQKELEIDAEASAKLHERKRDFKSLVTAQSAPSRRSQKGPKMIYHRDEGVICKTVTSKTKIDGKIKSAPPKDVTLYFKDSDIPHAFYRSRVQELAVIDGQLQLTETVADEHNIHLSDTIGTYISNENNSGLILTKLGQPFALRHCQRLIPGEVLGCVTFKLSTSNWSILPTFSTESLLISIDARHPVKLITARHKLTRQWLVKLAPLATPETQDVTIDFTIFEPWQKTHFLRLRDQVSLLQSPCHQQISHTLDAELFNTEDQSNSVIKHLKGIKSMPTPEDQLRHLILFFRGFDANKDIEGSINGNFEVIIQSIKSQQGVCLHRALGFHLICQYLGIRSRIISNDVHSYIEVGVEEEGLWRKVDLGGKHNTGKTYTPDYLDMESASPTVDGESAYLNPFSPQNNDPLTNAMFEAEDSEDFEETELAETLESAPLHKILTLEDLESPKKSQLRNFELLANAYIDATTPDDQLYFIALIKTLKSKRVVHEFHDLVTYLDDVNKQKLLLKNDGLIIAVLPELFKLWYRHAKEYATQKPLYGQDSLNRLNYCIYQYFLAIHELYRNKLINDQCYLTFCEESIELFETEQLSIGQYLPILEHIAQYSSQKQRAEKILEQYYLKITSHLSWSDKVIQELDCTPPEKELGGTTHTIKQKLVTTHVTSSWSWRKGNAIKPDLQRWAQKRAPYLHTFREIAKKPAVLCLPLDRTRDLDKIFEKHLNAHGILFSGKVAEKAGFWNIRRFYQKFDQVEKSYFQFLAEEVISEDGACVITVPSRAFFQTSLTHLSAGHYSMRPDRDWLMSLTKRVEPRMSRYSGIQGKFLSYKLNPERLKKALNHSNFSVIHSETIEKGFDEFLNTIDWEALLQD